MDVFLYPWKHVGNGLTVARTHVVGPETIMTHTGQHLHGQFILIVSSRNGCKDGAIGPLPPHQFMNTLASQQVSLFVEGIESFAQLIYHVAPPLGTLAIGTVHIGVAHGDVERTLRLVPQTGEHRVIAGETAGKGGVVTRLTVLHIEHFHTFRKFVLHIVTVHPALAFEHLFSFARTILGKYVGGRTAPVIVRTDTDALTCRCFQSDVGSNLCIVRQVSPQQRIALHLCLRIRLQPVVFPERNGTVYQLIPSGFFQ